MKHPQQLHDAAWPDMFENLQTAYAELVRAQFELERRSAQIDETRDLFQRVIQSMSEALFLLDTNGRVVQANHAAALLLAEEEPALVGRPLEVLCGTAAIPATPWQLLEQAPEGTLRNLDIELRPPRGRSVPVSISCGLVRDHRGKVTGVLAVVRDITERKRAEEALRFLAEASRALAGSLDLKTVLRNLARLTVPTIADWCSIDLVAEDGAIEQVGVAHVDPDKEEVIRELRRRFPLSDDAPLGYPQVLRLRRPIMIRRIEGDQTASIAQTAEHRRLIEELGFTSHLCVPMFVRDRVIGAITLNLARPDRHYEQADLELAQDLAGRAAVAVENARLYETAQDANRMKDEFLATLSHELRTPLNAVLGWSRLLRAQAPPSPQIDRALEVIERNARAQQQLIEDLLDLSRIVTGKVRFDPQPVDVVRVVETTLDGLRLAAEAKGLEVRLSLTGQGERVAGDPDRLQQVTWNLLSNAIKFTPPGGFIDVSTRRIDSHIEIVIADSGRGIRPEFLPHVFDRFRQQDASTTRTHGGLGLGLAIVKSLVELHGGAIVAESAGEGMGARFVVRLPLLRTQPAARPLRGSIDGPADEGEHVQGDLTGVRVLVVEDEPDTRDLLHMLLEGWGATVTLVASATEAFTRIVEAPPDLLVSDIGLPREDGYSLLRRVRGLPPEAGGRVPALALTAYARDEDRKRAEAVGFQQHISKPFDPYELAAAIRTLLGRTPS